MRTGTLALLSSTLLITVLIGCDSTPKVATTDQDSTKATTSFGKAVESTRGLDAAADERNEALAESAAAIGEE
jgi:uncharacterized protein YcfL